jgi:MOSC domain-containing protein YiiM
MAGMKLISVNVGLPREVVSDGKVVTTGIFKEPVQGRVRVRTLNLEGDRQADLTVHGGKHKAVYGYPAEHYEYWRAQFPDKNLGWGMFGENLTLSGLLENEVHVGDRFRVGSALLMVTQPRLPCYKLGIKFGRADMVKRFLESRRTGFYFSVLEEGEVGAEDSVELVSKSQDSVTVTGITELYGGRKNGNGDLLKRALATESLPESWRDYFWKQLHQLDTAGRK